MKTKTISQLELTRAFRFRGTFLTVLAGCLAVGLPTTHAAAPSLQPLIHPGKWPVRPQERVIDVKVAGNYAYIALGPGGLGVIDVSNPANPVRVGGYTNGGFTSSVAVSGSRAYVAVHPAGLQVLDVSIPANPQRIGGVAGSYMRTVVVSGNRAYVTQLYGGLVIYDVSNPTAPVGLGGYRSSSDGDSVTYGAVVSGNDAYLWVEDIGLLVIDVSNPTNCVRTGWYHAVKGEVNGVAVSGNYAFVADDEGLQVLDVSIPANPVRVGGYAAGGYAIDVALWGNHAYLTSATGLQVLDASDPANCVRVGGHDTSGQAYGVAVDAGRIYVADGVAGLVVLPTLSNVQFTVRVDATPGVPFTLEAATDLSTPFPWTRLMTTNVTVTPFDFVDFDVRLSEKPQKYYRVRGRARF